MCVETLRTGLVFPRWLICRGHMPRFTWKMNVFPIYLLRNARNVCWNHQNRGHFSEMIDLRGHMPRFTWKMNVFPSISLEMPEMCVETIRTEVIFLRWLIWGVTCLGLLEKWTFFHQSTWQLHKWVLELSEKGLFLWDYRFEGSHV